MNIKKLWNDLCLQRGKKTYKGKLIEGEKKFRCLIEKAKNKEMRLKRMETKKLFIDLSLFGVGMGD